MQCTHFVADELESRKGLREGVSLQGHTDFAAEVLGLQERQRLLHEVEEEAREGLQVWRGLLTQLGVRRWVLAVWAAEAMFITALVFTGTAEIWSHCPLEVGPLLACRHCFGGVLAAWELGVALFWALHLYLSVLLVSRGFSFAPARPQQLEKNRGVPSAAVQLLLFLSAALLALLVAGIVLLLASRSCTGGTDFGPAMSPLARPLRSPMMQHMATITVLLAPPLVVFGRLSH